MAGTMLAVVKSEAAPGADVREVKIPAFGRTDVLVKVKVASICGTDLHVTTGIDGRRTGFTLRSYRVTSSAARWLPSETK